ILDKIIERYVDEEQSIDDIVKEGFEREVVTTIVHLINKSEYKRRQAPIGIRIDHKAFGRDRRYPITSGFDK
ncbi:MAG TPA: NAD+ synthase, partial [Gammaproteobacteria bacterium]|nr:NAD+ synthase [Gammaproteobacteria bacterium]